MMKILLLAVGVVCLIFCVPIIFGDRRYRRGESLERSGKYKEAVYEYAIAILNGSVASKSCKKKIVFLWKKYGPFDYSDVLEEAKKDDTPEHCGEAGHAATMSIIKEVAG